VLLPDIIERSQQEEVVREYHIKRNHRGKETKRDSSAYKKKGVFSAYETSDNTNDQ